MEAYMMTELQKRIVILMRDAGIEKEAGLVVITNLETVKEQEEMLEFLQQHPTTTNRQAVMKAKEIIQNN